MDVNELDKLDRAQTKMALFRHNWRRAVAPEDEDMALQEALDAALDFTVGIHNEIQRRKG